MIIQNILYVAVLINLIATFYYCKDIFNGHTKPNLISWFFWALVPLIGVFFQIKAGAGLSVLPILTDGLNCFIIIIFSLWNENGYWKIERFDIICGILAFMSLVFYIFSHNLSISLVFAICADFFAAIPTIVKSWKFPETETGGVYIVAALTNVFGLLIIKNWIFPIYSYGIYFVLMNLLVVFCVYRKKLASFK